MDDFPSAAQRAANDEQFFHRVRDPRAARDVAVGEPWSFPDHRSLAEVIAAEQQQ
jgi:hypothetical protein